MGAGMPFNTLKSFAACSENLSFPLLKNGPYSEQNNSKER